MIQRVQSLYLLITTIVTAIMFAFPLAFMHVGDETYNIMLTGIVHSTTGVELTSVWPLMLLVIIVPVLSMLIIFMYKKRILQIRLGIVNIALMLGFYGLLALILIPASKDIGGEIEHSFPLVFPFVGVILTIMANIRIRKDENLVKSMDRIR